MIIDAHQHFWNLQRTDYGWLTPQLEPLYRDFLPEDMAPLLTKAGVNATVLVQAAPTEAETEYLLDLANSHGWIGGVVGWVDLASEDVGDRLDALIAYGKGALKGIRPMIQDIADPEWIVSPQLDAGFAALESRGLVFDALVRPLHLENLLNRLCQHRELTAIVDHGAKPDIAQGERDQWQTGLAAIASQTSAYCKLSGLVTEAGQGWSERDIAPYFDGLLEMFGPSRLIWGSDWPVLNLASDYDSWLALSKGFCAGLTPGEKRSIFGENARSAYSLELADDGRKTAKKALLLHQDDNILIACAALEPGDTVDHDGTDYTVTSAIEVGHKISRSAMSAGTKIIRYGAPIGSLVCDVIAGEHIHVHNLHSDYIASHDRHSVGLEG